MKAFRYCPDDGERQPFREIDIYELEGVEGDWESTMKKAGFARVQSLGHEMHGATFGMDLYRHEKYGFLIDVAWVWTETIVWVVCHNGPNLLLFLRDFAPLLQAMTVSEQLGPLLQKVDDTIFDHEYGVQPVVDVADRERRKRKENLDRKAKVPVNKNR